MRKRCIVRGKTGAARSRLPYITNDKCMFMQQRVAPFKYVCMEWDTYCTLQTQRESMTLGRSMTVCYICLCNRRRMFLLPVVRRQTTMALSLLIAVVQIAHTLRD